MMQALWLQKLQRTRSHSQPKAIASPTVWGTSSRCDIATSHIAARDIAARLAQFFLKVADQSDESLAKETKSVPIVFVLVSDPLGSGLVGSLSHPGGNVTGFASFEYSLGGKWVELISEIAPRMQLRGGLRCEPTS
jgi:ABC-type uncharacterized transport system substrate-binding protein